jgi:exodeoxyribonuclease X
MIIRVLDLETTGLAPPDAAVCEVGWTDMQVTYPDTSIDATVFHLCNPGRPIPPQAMAVHHITDADVAEAASPTEAFRKLMDGADVFAAHKASFEQQFFEGGDKPWICTWKVAIKMAPRAPGHTNQVLRYWLNLAVDPVLAAPPHRAGPDSYVTAHLLARMLTKMSPEEMIAISAEPAVLPYFLFGKHAMKPIEEVPADYLEWCLRQDMDADVKHTCRYHLKRRAP